MPIINTRKETTYAMKYGTELYSSGGMLENSIAE
jgi:hypothetical protein